MVQYCAAVVSGCQVQVQVASKGDGETNEKSAVLYSTVLYTEGSVPWRTALYITHSRWRCTTQGVVPGARKRTEKEGPSGRKRGRRSTVLSSSVATQHSTYTTVSSAHAA